MNQTVAAISVSLFALSSAWAADYHVDQASPSATQNGSSANPFKTISQASAVMIAGDTCFIHRGIYRETIVPQNSGSASAPIRYVAYGNDSVVISATTAVSDWQVHSGSIYKAANVTLPLGNANMLYFNQGAQQLARWPNDLDGNPYTFDAYKIETAAGTYSDSYITYSSIPSYWTSGVIHWLGAHSGCAVQRNITGYDPVTHRLSFTTFPSVWPFTTHSPTRFENGHRGTFFLLNRLEALDAPGEWFYDSTAKVLYFYAPGGVNPSTGIAEFAARVQAIDSARNYIQFEKLNLFGGSARLSGANCRLTNLRIRNGVAGMAPDDSSAFAGGEAVTITGSNNQVLHCLIEEGSAAGVMISSSAANAVIENNVIRNFDKFGNHSSPIRSTGSNALVVRNRVSGSGRDCVRVSGAGSVVAYNEVFDGLLTCTDGGLFYVTGNSSPINVELHHNWFYRAYSPPAYTASHGTGIYLDNNSAGYKVHHNVVWDIQWGGLHFNLDALQNQIYNNTFWNVGAGEAVILSWIPVQNNVRTNVRDNTLINNLSDVRQWWYSADGSYVEDETLDNTFVNNLQVAASSFVSVATGNFMPVNTPAIVDQGQVIAGITDDYVGARPDVGAYEYGGYRWIPGTDWEPASFDWSLPTTPNSSPATFIADNFNPRTTSIFGTASAGTIQFRTNGPHSGSLPTIASDSPWFVDFQWTGLDLDGVGGANDTLYFSLKASGSLNGSTAKIMANDIGWGVLDTLLNPGESIRFEIADVALSAGTFGNAVFDGFREAHLIKTSANNIGVSASATINGAPFSFAASDNRYSTKGPTFTTPTARVELSCTAQNGVTIAARDFDLLFSYVPVNAAPPLLATLTANDFNPQNGTIYPLGTGGAASGSIAFDPASPNPGNIPISATNSPASVAFAMSGLDLDGVGGANDVIYFTLVATSGNGGKIQADNTGWGVTDSTLHPGERITYRIENVSISAGTSGSVKFDGFTGGRLINRNYTSGLTATGSINGSSVSWTGTGAANTFIPRGTHAAAPSGELLFAADSSTGINLSVRDFDLQFSYYAGAQSTNYAQWRVTRGLFDSNGVGDADADGDGESNDYEYFLGGDPLNASIRARAPKLSMSQGAIEFSHIVRTGALDLTYRIQFNPTLAPGGWQDATYVAKSINNLGNGYSELLYDIPLDGDRKFLRLRIER